MGIFSSIKDAIFGKDADAKAKSAPKPATHGQASSPRPGTQGNAARLAAARPISEVDVEARLDAMAGADKLNWRSSIVDLMKLIHLDPSMANRKELAQEMGRTDYAGAAEDNIWLHKRVMQEIAKAGGKVPASLRD